MIGATPSPSRLREGLGVGMSHRIQHALPRILPRAGGET